jgi:hypothetical protein
MNWNLTVVAVTIIALGALAAFEVSVGPPAVTRE